MPKRVCLYARVSKTSQSVERQISELEIVAARNDWEIVDRYIDHGISGAKGRNARPELDRMMKDSTKRKFDVVMVWSIDRLGRSLQNLMEILNDLKSKNIDLYMDQQAIDTTTPTGFWCRSMRRRAVRKPILSEKHYHYGGLANMYWKPMPSTH